jgi:hypothetical protein
VIPTIQKEPNWRSVFLLLDDGREFIVHDLLDEICLRDAGFGDGHMGLFIPFRINVRIKIIGQRACSR